MTSPRAASTARRTFIRHYVEMVVAMLLGMFALGGAFVLMLGALGVDVDSWSSEAPALLFIGMAFTMAAPMVAWMRYRGHGWTPALEMTAAMFVPSFAAVGLLWLDQVEDVDALLVIEHVAMLLAMLAVMLARYTEYAQRPPRVEPRTKFGAAVGTGRGRPTGQAAGAAEAAQAQALGTDDST
jgi:hypothetical protein